MRDLLVALLALGLLPTVTASEAYQVVVDWQDGTFLASTRVGVDDVDLWRTPVPLDACHREILVDVLFDPENITVATDGVGSVALLYEFRAEAWTGDGSEMLGERRIRAPGYGMGLGAMPAAGDYELRLFLVTGVHVDWSARVRAHEVPLDPACGNGL